MCVNYGGRKNMLDCRWIKVLRWFL